MLHPFDVSIHLRSAPFIAAPVGGLSIDAALSGSILSYGVRTGVTEPKVADESKASGIINEPAIKKEWFFDIHEDTLDETLTNIMEFSTHTLDISDNEGRRKEKNEKGKENVPPMEENVVAGVTFADTSAELSSPTVESALMGRFQG